MRPSPYNRPHYALMCVVSLSVSVQQYSALVTRNQNVTETSNLGPVIKRHFSRNGQFNATILGHEIRITAWLHAQGCIVKFQQGGQSLGPSRLLG